MSSRGRGKRKGFFRHMPPRKGIPAEAERPFLPLGEAANTASTVTSVEHYRRKNFDLSPSVKNKKEFFCGSRFPRSAAVFLFRNPCATPFSVFFGRFSLPQKPMRDAKKIYLFFNHHYFFARGETSE